jgi:two-component system KDP operon response regulator KdpE
MIDGCPPAHWTANEPPAVWKVRRWAAVPTAVDVDGRGVDGAVALALATARLTSEALSGAVAGSPTWLRTRRTATRPTVVARTAPIAHTTTSSSGPLRVGMPSASPTVIQDSPKPWPRSVAAGRVATTFRDVPQLLIIEDDPAIRTALVRALSERGHGVRTAATGMAGLQEAVDGRPDLVVLDLGLPDMDGCTLLAMLRAVSEVPVIVATARDDERETVRALDAGADDYVVKPFAAEQLEARIRAVLRRGTSTDQPIVEVGGLRVDTGARSVSLDGTAVELTRKEFDLLAHLASKAGTVVSKRELLAEVWHQPYGGGDKTVDVHLSWLRRKLGESAAAPRYVVSVRGVGVKLVDPDS